MILCRQSGALNNTQGSAPSPGNKDLTTIAPVSNMPQPQGSVPRTTAAVHTYSADARHNMSVSFVERKSPSVILYIYYICVLKRALYFMDFNPQKYTFLNVNTTI